MGVTGFSFILLPLCLIWIMRPERILLLIPLVSVFEAAAALTVGDLGIQPGLVPALIFMGFVILQYLLGTHYRGELRAFQLTKPFILVVCWALASSFIMPRLFEGKAYVWPQKSSPPFVLTLLAPNPANINQDFYLALNAALLVLAAMFMTKPDLPLAKFMRAYLLGGLLAAVVAVWQFASKVAGVPFPSDFFYSNPGWAILTGQQMGSVPRINGPFSEPAALGGYMGSIVCTTGWLLLQGSRDREVRLMFAVGLLTMILSTSATGFGLLAVIIVGVPIYAFMSGSKHLMKGILKLAVPLMLILTLLGFVASIFAPAMITATVVMLDATANKQESSSYQERTSADADSLQAAVDTYGLGVGWGSNRSSSLVPGLLASVGVPGVCGLLYFAYRLAANVRSAKRSARSNDELFVINGVCGALCGFIIAAGLSGPTITSPTFYFLISLLIACVVRVEADAGRRRSALPGRTIALSPRG